MSQDFNLIAAIDIGSTKIVAVAGRKHPNGQIEVLGVQKTSSTGVKRGIVLNIEETVKSIRQVVSSLQQRLNIRISDVFVGFSGQNVRTMVNRCYRSVNRGNEINTFDLEQLLQDSYRTIVLEPDEKVLHVIPQDYIVDHESGIKEPVGYSGQRIEGNFHVVLWRNQYVHNIEKCIERAGLRLNGLLFSPLAASGAVLSEEEKEAGVVMVDIGGGTTDLSVFHDGILRHSAVIPFGGNVITGDIKEGCAVLQKQAEGLKTQFGSALGTQAREDAVVTIPGIEGWEPKEISFKSLACIIQARMEEIIELIVHHIERSGFYEKLGAGIVLTGGGAMLSHIAELTKLKTGFDVRVGAASRVFSNEESEILKNPAFSTSVGLLASAGQYPGSLVTREQVLFDDVETEEPVREKKSKPSGAKSRKPRKDKKLEYITGDLFGNIKRNIAGIFDERDTEM